MYSYMELPTIPYAFYATILMLLIAGLGAYACPQENFEN